MTSIKKIADDFKEEYLPRLERNGLYSILKSKCVEKDEEVIVLVNKAVEYSVQRTKSIIRHMKGYTLHDSDHLFRVLHLMERLIPEETKKNLSIPELMLLILGAFFHDIGMAPDEKQVLTWKKLWDSKPEIDDEEKEPFEQFKRFYSARPDQQEVIEKLSKEGRNSELAVYQSHLITEFIRQSHAERAREIIDKDWNDKIRFRNTDLTVELASLCHSHNEDALRLLEFDKNLPLGNDTYVCLPLVGILLRLADILDFDAKRTPGVLYSHLYVRHPVSIEEWEKHRAVENWTISPDEISYSAKCNHPAIEAAINRFCDVIDHELSTCNNIITVINPANEQVGRSVPLKIPFHVNRSHIQTKKDIYGNPKYTYRDTKFTLSKKQVIDLLMGTKLYGSPEVALRELIQNSIDACLLRQAQEKVWGNPYSPEIKVKYYSEGQDYILEVEDNGTGMDQAIIDNYYSKVGSSFYKSTDFYNLKAQSNAVFTPTSRFGIGILSCFMVADTLMLDTRRIYGPHKSSDPINVTVEGQESIFWIRSGERETPGTTTKLILRQTKNPWGRLTDLEFIKSVENIVYNPPFPIRIKTTEHQKERNKDSFKKMSASALRDYRWQKDNEHLKTFSISLDNEAVGFIGSVEVAILERKGMPAQSIALTAKDINVDGETFTLEKSIELETNRISESSKSITITDDGNITVDDSTRTYAISKSQISLHGIEVPSTLFPERWRKKANQVELSWPLPLLIIVDICGTRDLDLNSPRTEIVFSDKWLDFEEELAFTICSKIRAQVSQNYWESLKKIFNDVNKSEAFKRGLNRIEE